MTGYAVYLIFLATVSIFPGQVVQLSVPTGSGMQAAVVDWNDQLIPYDCVENYCYTMIGVDLDVAPGDYSAETTMFFADGTERRITHNIQVQEKTYPTTRLEVEPKYVELSAENQARTAKEREEINAIYTHITPEAYWSEPFSVPIPGVTGGRNFGRRRVFNDQPRSPHSGADLKAATGDEIHASNRGKVVLAKNLFFSGNAVFVDHGLGVYSVYLHLSEYRVAVGDTVERGQVIGRAGATGRVTGPHLHWGMRVSNARVDPFSVLDSQAPPEQ
ncbi:MAG: M23 family metallopeptidase [Gammaproteobacteria bacterium]